MQSQISENIKKLINNLPDNPGVYFFCDQNGKILYIGKATSLRDRVKSYFKPEIVNTRSPLVSKMLQAFTKIDFCETDSVLEALVLEAYLIKKHQPEANIQEKDNKSFNFVVITDEAFPQILVLRGRELILSGLNKKQQDKLPYKIAYSFGPFPNGSQLREALKIIRKMFPYRDSKCIPASEQKRGHAPKACFNRQIGLCPGVCTGEITQEDYAMQVKNIILFFEGRKKRLIGNLERQMKVFAKNKEFERANGVKRTMFTLNHIQDISLIKEENSYKTPNGEVFRIESYDIAHLSGQNVVGVMTVVEEGEAKKSDYRKFHIKEDPGVNDTKALGEVLTRRLAHIEWRLPDLIVVDGGQAQKRAMERIIAKNIAVVSQRIPVVSVVKNERHQAREILGDKRWLVHEREIILSNSEAHRFAISFHRNLRSKKDLMN
ncbi:GIY-YIG nuclease family protein [Patescibacteria group bacterium]|nr:GIY-YIG nuclease family protein [Patescibacteria group bacterium]